MGFFKDTVGFFKSSRDGRDGTVKHDRYTKESTAKHSQHDWSRTDPVSGQHKEGTTGPHAPRTRDKD